MVDGCGSEDNREEKKLSPDDAASVFAAVSAQAPLALLFFPMRNHTSASITLGLRRTSLIAFSGVNLKVLCSQLNKPI